VLGERIKNLKLGSLGRARLFSWVSKKSLSPLCDILCTIPPYSMDTLPICALKNQKEKPILIGCIWVNKFALESGGSKLQFPFHKCTQFWKYCTSKLCNSFGTILGQIIFPRLMSCPPIRKKKGGLYNIQKSTN